MGKIVENDRSLTADHSSILTAHVTSDTVRDLASDLALTAQWVKTLKMIRVLQRIYPLTWQLLSLKLSPQWGKAVMLKIIVILLPIFPLHDLSSDMADDLSSDLNVKSQWGKTFDRRFAADLATALADDLSSDMVVDFSSGYI